MWEFWENRQNRMHRLAARGLPPGAFLVNWEILMFARATGDAGYGKSRFVLLLGVGSSNWTRAIR